MKQDNPLRWKLVPVGQDEFAYVTRWASQPCSSAAARGVRDFIVQEVIPAQVHRSSCVGCRLVLVTAAPTILVDEVGNILCLARCEYSGSHECVSQHYFALALALNSAVHGIMILHATFLADTTVRAR